MNKFKATEFFTKEEIRIIKLICKIFNAEYVFIDEIKYEAPK